MDILIYLYIYCIFQFQIDFIYLIVVGSLYTFVWEFLLAHSQ